jgi:hypothetical protein
MIDYLMSVNNSGALSLRPFFCLPLLLAVTNSGSFTSESDVQVSYAFLGNSQGSFRIAMSVAVCIFFVSPDTI